MQPQPLFVFLQFEVGSDENILEFSNKLLLTETKLNRVNIKATRVYSVVKKTNIYLPSSLMTKVQNLVY